MNSLVIRICNYWVRKGIITATEISIYQYGFEILFSSVITISIILFLGIVIDSPVSGFVYLLVMIPLRVTLGGYHAATHKTCLILSILDFVFVLTINHILSQLQIPKACWILLIAVSYLLLRKRKVIRNRHHPISEQTVQKNLMRAHIIIWIQFISQIILYLTSVSQNHLHVAAATVMYEAISQFIYGRRNQHD